MRDVFLPTSPSLPHDRNMSSHSLAIHYPNSDREPNLEAEESRRPAFDTRYPAQGTYSPTSSITWQISPLTPGVATRSPHEVLGGVGLFGPTPVTLASYSGMYSDQDLLPNACESVQPISNLPTFLYSPSQRTLDQPLSGPPSALINCDVFTLRSEPSYTPSSSDRHHDHHPFDPWPNPVGYAPGHQLSPVEDKRTPPGSRSPNPAQHSIRESDPSTSSSLLLQMPSNWRKIPQERYVPKTGGGPFSPHQAVKFSINGSPGFNMKQALNQAFTDLDRRDEPVLANANSSVSCRLLFPGYPANTQLHNQIALKDYRKDPSPIKKSKLAHVIAKNVHKYLNSLATIAIDPSVDPEWTVGQGFMELEKMYLVNVSWVSKGSIQPEIWVETNDSRSGKSYANLTWESTN